MAANRYELKEVLGEGGMGVVYRAFDTRTKSEVAIKTLRDSSDATMLEMFKREWAELADVYHPNIVDIRDVDEIEIEGIRKPCFIMPLLRGETLAALIKSSSPRLTNEFIVNMLCQVCKGLQFAHEKDLIHRDLKPSNIFITNDDTAKIIDFGLVHAVGNKSVTGLKGTWQYMSPEQIEGKQPNRSYDIFSLGIVAYESFTGHQPFKRSKFEDTVEAVRYFVPQAISERNPKVPVLLSKAVHVAMAKQPIHRYASAKEFAETLQKAYNGQYIERFDPAKIRPRIERAKRAFNGGDSEFASEILTELEAEGNLDTDITLLRSQIDEFNKQKRIRQLFEAAQTRVEQEEIPLALEKLDEVLRIDPQHPEALSLRKRIETQRSQQQMADWLTLARRHLDQSDFSEARKALREVFKLRYDDPEAAKLQAEVDAREKEVATARDEKEHLYSSALKAHQSGEISSALSKLEKILDLSRGVPGASVPERDKVFQAFYNDVRTERDRIDNAYAEGTRHLAEKNFDKAMQVCDSILARYPRNPQFQALKIKVDNCRRQEFSAFIAEVSHAVDNEPNLDRRVGLLEEACKRYPNEAQFSRQLSLARDLRDLVASIVTRARAYEEQCQFAEAIAQWNTLANIHPQYPGIDFEISQLERRRDQHAIDEKKSKLVQRIDRALENSAFADAERLSQDGLLEFPQNPELLALLRVARLGVERTREASRLFEEAKALRAGGAADQAIDQLRQALELDKRNIVIHNTLVNLLVERAHALIDEDWTEAEPLAAEAGRLDPEHPSVGKVVSLIAQAKRKHYVDHCVFQARDLQTSDLDQAVGVLKDGLRVYPGDLRLQQTLTSLQKDARFVGAVATGYAPEKETVVFPLDYTEVAHPKPPQPNRKPPPPPARPSGPATPPPKSTPPWWKETLQQIAILLAKIQAAFLEGASALFSHRHRNWIGAILGLIAAILLFVAGYKYLNRPVAPTPKISSAFSNVKISVQPTPADATIILNGQPSDGGSHAFRKGSSLNLTVARLGYIADSRTIQANADNTLAVSLKPEPLHMSVATSETTGNITLDGKQLGTLQDGEWQGDYELQNNAEEHTLAATGKSGELFEIHFKAGIAQAPVVGRVKSSDIVVASVLGKDATLFGAKSKGQRISPEGTAVNLEQTPDGKLTAPLLVEQTNAPTLSVSLNGAANLTTVTVTSTPKTAKLFINNQQQRTRKAGFWSLPEGPGTYNAKLTADGMDDDTFAFTIRKGDKLPPFARTMKAHGPAPVTLVISGGEPHGIVSVGESAVGELDDQGNISAAVYQTGVHNISVSKPGYESQVIAGRNFTPGQRVQVDGKKLEKEAGFVLFQSVNPPTTSVRYRAEGESEPHADSAPMSPLRLTPGDYEFTAEAPGYSPEKFSVTIERAKTTQRNIFLRPAAAPVEERVEFVSPNDAEKLDHDWYTGKSKGFIPLKTTHAVNSIIFLKGKAKKMSWRIMLDNDNVLNYTLDNKNLAYNKSVGGVSHTDKNPVDMSGGGTNQNTEIVVIHLESNGVRITKEDGTDVDKEMDSKDWRHAKLLVKGDTTFTVWLGR